MRRIWQSKMSVAVLVAMALGLAGCSGGRSDDIQEITPAAAPRVATRAMSADGVVADGAQAKEQGSATAQPNQFLAYEHHLSLEAPPAQVSSLHDKALELCRALPEGGCILLEARSEGGQAPSAFLRLRVLPQELPKLVAALGQMGEVVGRSTTVEDLATPMGDTKKRIELLTSYRSQLETLRAKAGNDVESAIKIAQELARVQSELESVSGELAHLDKRVRTEILNLNIQPLRHATLRSPIGDALAAFANNLARAVAAVITFVAYALPWGLLLGVLIWAGRLLWRRRRMVLPAAHGSASPTQP